MHRPLESRQGSGLLRGALHLRLVPQRRTRRGQPLVSLPSVSHVQHLPFLGHRRNRIRPLGNHLNLLRHLGHLPSRCRHLANPRRTKDYQPSLTPHKTHLRLANPVNQSQLSGRRNQHPRLASPPNPLLPSDNHPSQPVPLDRLKRHHRPLAKLRSQHQHSGNQRLVRPNLNLHY